MIQIIGPWLVLDALIFLLLRKSFLWVEHETWFAAMGIFASWILLLGVRTRRGK